MKKRISILGSTGSIGINALKIADSLPDIIKIKTLLQIQILNFLLNRQKNIIQDQFV
mgnify:CR=1 FL=1